MPTTEAENDDWNEFRIGNGNSEMFLGNFDFFISVIENCML